MRLRSLKFWFAIAVFTIQVSGCLFWIFFFCMNFQCIRPKPQMIVSLKILNTATWYHLTCYQYSPVISFKLKAKTWDESNLAQSSAYVRIISFLLRSRIKTTMYFLVNTPFSLWLHSSLNKKHPILLTRQHVTTKSVLWI